MIQRGCIHCLKFCKLSSSASIYALYNVTLNVFRFLFKVPVGLEYKRWFGFFLKKKKRYFFFIAMSEMIWQLSFGPPEHCLSHMGLQGIYKRTCGQSLSMFGVGNQTWCCLIHIDCCKLTLKQTISEIQWSFFLRGELLYQRFQEKMNFFVVSVTGELGQRS